MRLGIVSSLFNDDIASRLLSRAEAEAAKLGLKGVVIERVPGALEIPLALQWMAQSGRFDELVAVGAGIDGEPAHLWGVWDRLVRAIVDVAVALSGERVG